MKAGITTGSCAALAAKAAALLLFNRQQEQKMVEIPLPDGSRLRWEVKQVQRSANGAEASVIKDAGDDPDVTHGACITVYIEANDSAEIVFRAGDGVGTVTLPGLAIGVGEAAINPVPRAMISAALREVTTQGVNVTVAVAGGCELAQKTFNPKLGITGGISIIGTSGRVRPFSAPALRQSLKCALDICVAANNRAPVLVPGNMGYKAAHHYFKLQGQQVVEVSNEWGFMLDQTLQYHFDNLLIVGHPGKLGKLANGQWQTHSAQSDSAVPFVTNLANTLLARQLKQSNTVEELFMARLNARERQLVAQTLAESIRASIVLTFSPPWQLAVVLINLQGEMIANAGDLRPWQ